MYIALHFTLMKRGPIWSTPLAQLICQSKSSRKPEAFKIMKPEIVLYRYCLKKLVGGDTGFLSELEKKPNELRDEKNVFRSSSL